MEFLEFLIQKEGDRSWLPLDSPEAEILEGRYRVMARCDRGNAPVDIRITYLDLDAVPLRRRVHNVTRPTTDRGLLAVMPFTPLSTGTWTLRCAAPVNAHEKPAWHYTLQLQVLEENAHHEADFEPEFDPEALHRTTSPPREEATFEAAPVSQEASLTGEDLLPESDLDSQHSESELTTEERSPTDELDIVLGHSAPIDSPEMNQDEAQDELLQDPWSSNVHAVQFEGGEATSSREDVSDSAAAFNSDHDDVELGDLADFEQPAGDAVQLDIDPPAIDPPAEDFAAEAPSPEAEMPEGAASDERTVPSQSPTSLPAEWENLPLDMQQEMAHMFQAVDDMAADILASMNQRFESIFPISSTMAPSELEASDESQSPEFHQSDVSLSDGSPVFLGDVESSEDRDALDLPPEDPQLSQAGISSDEGDEAVQSASSSTSTPVEPRNHAQVPVSIPNVELRLAQDTFSVGREQPLTVSGQIVTVPSHFAQTASSTDSTISPLHVLLTLQLTDPQTGTVQAKAHQSLTLSASAESQTSFAPLPFEMMLNLAPTLQTHLLLGEAVLSLDEHATGESSTQSENSTAPISLILASYGFVVTLEMDALLGAIAHPSGTLPLVNPPLAFVEPDEEPAQATPTEHLPPRPLRVSNQLNLPPQLYEAGADDEGSDRPPLDLPEFVKSSTTIAPGLLYLVGLSHLATGASDSHESEAEDSDLKFLTAGNADSESSEFESSSLDSAVLEVPSDAENSFGEEFAHRSSEAGSAVQDEADSLEFAEKFSEDFSKKEFSKETSKTDLDPEKDGDKAALNPFADGLQELELPLEQGRGYQYNPLENVEFDESESDRPVSSVQPDESVGLDEPIDSSNSIDPFELDSGELEAIALTSSLDRATHDPSSQAVESMAAAQGTSQEVMSEANGRADARGNDYHNEYQAAPAVTPQSQEITIPVPQLHIAEDELIAGQPVRMSITLPEMPMQVFVKLWVQDRQTRTLLDGPRWIADFIADGAGSTEARIQFTVPLGCVEMRIEAIAVDVLSQRESHKTGIDRSVVPPDLPALSLDDFN